jgi:hypothetical protein
MKNKIKKRTDGQTRLTSQHNWRLLLVSPPPPIVTSPNPRSPAPDYYYTAQQNDWFMFKLTAPLSCCCCCSGRESRSFEFERGEKIAPGRTEGARGAQSYIKRVSPHHHPLNLLLLLLRWYQGLVYSSVTFSFFSFSSCPFIGVDVCCFSCC